MTIYEQLKEVMEGKKHSIFTASYIKNELHEKYGTNPTSVIPSDFCYNRINDGIMFRKDTRLFKYIRRNSYEYIGNRFPYTGIICHRPHKSKTDIIVGEWLNGNLKYLL